MAALCLLIGWGAAVTARPQIFVPDPVSGYALGGHDPVAYFVDGYPRKGRRDYVASWGGADWIFVNEGNKAAFEGAPQTYAPLFAGCGAYGLAEGFAAAGSPLIFAFVEGQLVFFYSRVNRFLFLINAGQLREDADGNARITGCVPDL
ncbi:hypothetical protein GCM10011316_01410 [Roseibium aquae]|uniref:YHS domain-containing protein n=1 Tax=Roseibium aquae TaxID=1323746 RepID=A0A916T754_9HYPH|nr:YHS domain-containing (seleno)protein [Roseibium aquae]GGB33027.1 hypothetical protein GCM10011316_01410 [Roseibium aquae]